MSAANDWPKFFDAHAPHYLGNVFTRHTVAETDFLFQHLGLRTGMRLLDIGCGTGRHSVELARRGLDVTGVDLSAGMLREAHRAATQSGVTCRFIQVDAVAWRPDDTYDAVICLCEGAFCLLGQSDDPVDRDLRILQNLSHALSKGGRFMLTALSASRLIRSFDRPGFQGSFDLRTLVQTGSVVPAEGAEAIPTRERTYLATELETMCRTAGLTVTHIGGGTAGNWGIRPLDPDEIELMVLGRK